MPYSVLWYVSKYFLSCKHHCGAVNIDLKVGETTLDLSGSPTTTKTYLPQKKRQTTMPA